MRCDRILVPAVALLLSVGCAHTKKLEVWATLVDAGSGNRRVDIDESKHDSAVVGPGDRVVWICHCPAGTEFTVEDLHFVGDLEDLAEKLSLRQAPLAEDELNRTMEQMRAQAAGPGAAAAAGPGEAAAPEPLVGGRIRFEPVGGMLLVMKDFETAAPGERGRSLFVGRARGAQSLDFEHAPAFNDAARPMRSTRVAPGLGHELWKFTWRVQLIGDPESADTFDPHIFGHPDLKGG